MEGGVRPRESKGGTPGKGKEKQIPRATFLCAKSAVMTLLTAKSSSCR